MEAVLVSGVTADKNEAKVTLIGVPDKPGTAAKIFQPLSEANIVVDMIIQNISDAGRTDLTFTVPRADLKRAVDLIKRAVPEMAEQGIKTDDGHRQGLGRRRRHALARRRRLAHVRDPGARGHQHPHDLDLRRSRSPSSSRPSTPSSRCACSTTASSSASPPPEPSFAPALFFARRRNFFSPATKMVP